MPDEPGKVEFKQDYVVFTPQSQGVYPIPEREWNRLKRRIECIAPSGRWFQNAGAIAYGVTASSVFSLFGFQTATQLATWVVPTTWAILIASFIIGTALFILDTLQPNAIRATVADVMADIAHLEETFVRPDAGALPATTSPATASMQQLIGLGTVDVSGRAEAISRQIRMFKRRDSNASVEPSDVSMRLFSQPQLIQVGARVRHRKFGVGTIAELAGEGRDLKAKVDFEDPAIGRKTLVVAQAHLEAE